MAVPAAESAVATAAVRDSGAAATASGFVSTGTAGAVAVGAVLVQAADGRLDRIREARLQGYEGDACGECGNFTLVRNGTCMKCATCGSTSGCS
jgi:ribonucleoside-diphosphate reductase alpha chain